MVTAVAPNTLPTMPVPNISPSELPAFVDHLWHKAAARIKDGSTNEIRVPFSVKAVIGQQGLDVIKTRFQYVIAFTFTSLGWLLT